MAYLTSQQRRALNLKFHETITEYTPRYKISNLKFQI